MRVFTPSNSQRHSLLFRLIATPIASTGSFLNGRRWRLDGRLIVQEVIDAHVANWLRGIDRLESVTGGWRRRSGIITAHVVGVM
jgi:hypothetical protein